MNQRIKNLLETSGLLKILNEHAHEYGNGSYENTPYPEAEEFAELILLDCIDILMPYVVKLSRPGEEYLHPIDEIKKHFGVE